MDLCSGYGGSVGVLASKCTAWEVSTQGKCFLYDQAKCWTIPEEAVHTAVRNGVDSSSLFSFRLLDDKQAETGKGAHLLLKAEAGAAPTPKNTSGASASSKAASKAKAKSKTADLKVEENDDTGAAGAKRGRSKEGDKDKDKAPDAT